MLPEDTLAKGIANRCKTKGVRWRLRRGWFLCQSQGVTHTHCSTWLKWLKSALLVRHTCPTWRAWNTVWVKASSYWPTQMVLKGEEMGEGARQWKKTSKFLLENLFKTTSDICHTENKRPLLPWSLHTYRICIKHCVNSAASPQLSTSLSEE